MVGIVPGTTCGNITNSLQEPTWDPSLQQVCALQGPVSIPVRLAVTPKTPASREHVLC
jgi:hypothetical protein